MKNHILLLVASCMMGSSVWGAVTVETREVGVPLYSREDGQELAGQYQRMSDKQLKNVLSLVQLIQEYSTNLKIAQQGEMKVAVTVPLRTKIGKIIGKEIMASIAKNGGVNEKTIEEDFNRAIDTLCTGISYHVAACQGRRDMQRAAYLQFCRNTMKDNSISMFSEHVDRFISEYHKQQASKK